ncbi:4-oxalocrotonate tautomerase [Paenibacillus sp. JGP012]|uniref:Tautomerase n=2 Tax=Paenibacillus TaxID=44249 RepID=A0A2V4UY65_PAEBA|nr:MULTISPECIES: 2-hydroxymuconate tautomerase [Paenibacillus]MBB6019684.1 4-oxalocrotonate tautomerase [Paenibacillus sp. JGP012]MBU5352934.1 2-hydroxymuconate tautomerase family protein [Paenibacillus barcinonensis]MCK6076030.1 2-hydroxymuconate tautomerase family protein [Paenibacillus silvae]MCK6150419.1 2-hydroxymuconate tautomerase family protein [Paenibacillus silvae]MCK6268717.1 2-hydroxymuconate tautomerase family protein [Paenibacillus silvae]
MPFITVKVLEGKTKEQKRQLIERMTEVACETLGVEASKVFIFIEDLEKDNYGKNGKMFSDLDTN